MKKRMRYFLIIILLLSPAAVFASDRVKGIERGDWLVIAKATPQQQETVDLLSEDSSDLLEDESDDFLADISDEDPVYDPLEPLNRVFFEFNDRLYFWVLKPVKTGYSYIIPEDIRRCFGNFFNNLAAPIRLINNLLQGRFKDAGVVLSRFLINSTIGVYGFADVALGEFNMEPRLADFGQTLGVYGFGEGIYICWPVLGPSNLRDTIGLVGDTVTHPTFYVNFTTEDKVVFSAVNKTNKLSLTPSIYEDMKKYSLDPYSATKQAFYDYRRNFIKKSKDAEIGF